MGLIRVLLAISVFMDHVRGSSMIDLLSGWGGHNAVEVFFFISGFYIALILDINYKTYKSFLMNRCLRLFPIYYAIIFLVVVRAVLVPSLGKSIISYPLGALMIGSLSNLAILGSDWLCLIKWPINTGYLLDSRNSGFQMSDMLLIQPSWSLGIELTFYLIAPFICRTKFRVICAFCILLFTIRFISYYLGLNQDPWTYRFFPFELPVFLLGVLLYKAKEFLGISLRIPTKYLYLSVVTCYLGFPYAREILLTNRFTQVLCLLLLSSVCMIWGKDNEQDRKLGDLSYPIYMSHMFVVSTYGNVAEYFMRKYSFTINLQEPIVTAALSLLGTVLLSMFLLRLVRPIDKIRDRIRVGQVN